MSMSQEPQGDQIKPLSKLQKRLLFIIQRRPGQLSNFDLLNLNVRLGGEKEIDIALLGLEEAGLLRRTDRRKWQPTERGAQLVIPKEQLSR
jgi:hypothetical protein